MKFNLQLMRFLFKVMFPVNIVAFLLIAILGHLNPWPEATTLLEPHGEQFPVLVGYSYRSSTSNGRATEITSRSYALFPSVLSDFNTVEIIQKNNNKPLVEINNKGFAFYIGWLIICLIGTWWFWLRSPPNKAFQPTPRSGAAEL